MWLQDEQYSCTAILAWWCMYWCLIGTLSRQPKAMAAGRWAMAWARMRYHLSNSGGWEIVWLDRLGWGQTATEMTNHGLNKPHPFYFCFFEPNRSPSGKRMVTWQQVDKSAGLAINTVEPCTTDTFGDQPFVRYSEVSPTQRFPVHFR